MRACVRKQKCASLSRPRLFTHHQHHLQSSVRNLVPNQGPKADNSLRLFRPESLSTFHRSPSSPINFDPSLSFVHHLSIYPASIVKFPFHPLISATISNALTHTHTTHSRHIHPPSHSIQLRTSLVPSALTSTINLPFRSKIPNCRNITTS